MALYAYVCRTETLEHEVTIIASLGTAPDVVHCDRHDTECNRDFSSIRVVSDDPFRRSWLSSSMERNLADQRRALDPLAPKDKFEAAQRRETHGRVYIGDDTSSLSPKAQKAIAQGERRKGVARNHV